MITLDRHGVRIRNWKQLGRFSLIILIITIQRDGMSLTHSWQSHLIMWASKHDAIETCSFELFQIWKTIYVPKRILTFLNFLARFWNFSVLQKTVRVPLWFWRWSQHPQRAWSVRRPFVFPTGVTWQAFHERLYSAASGPSWFCLAHAIKQTASSSDPLVLLSPRVETAVCSSRAGKLEGKQHGRQVNRSKTPSDGRPLLQTSNLFPFMVLISRWWRNASYYGSIN